MTALVRYEAACRAVADAKTVDEVKDIRDKSVAMAAYARQAKNRDLEADAVEIRMLATRRLDQMRQAQKETVGLNTGSQGRRVDEKPTLASQGIDKNLAHQARTLGALSEDKFEAAVSDARQAVTSDVRIVRGTQGTGENEWYTPVDIIRVARSVLGAIDLDPASSEQAQGNVQALQYFTLADDGLAQPWHGKVWLNPPYAQPHIENFADKMIEEVTAGRVTAAIMLTHNYSDTAWFQKLATKANAVCFPRGRIRFVAPDGALAAPTQGQTFFYFGNDSSRFNETFCALGLVGALQ
jgi:phage N-6-adenine-methyltransferase